MTPEDKAYYGDGYQPLFDLMVDEHGLLLLEGEMIEIINCVRKMDEAQDTSFEAFRREWVEKGHNWDGKTISAQYIIKMLHAGYDYKRIIPELAKILDEVYGKLINKIEMSPPEPICFYPETYTIEQLQQLIDIKKAKLKKEVK